MPRDGCRQCSKRRIKCDGRTPSCVKCSLKGIECSGVGFQYRLVDSETRNKVILRYQSPSDTSQERDATQHASHEAWLSSLPPIPAGCDLMMKDQSSVGVVTSTSMTELIPTPVLAYPPSHLGLKNDLSIEVVRPGVAMLLDHFSRIIAPVWVVSDGHSNSYRDILLPLALQDETLQHAVCVVSAFHIAHALGQPCDYAESGRQVIISKLSADVLSGRTDRVFNLSTWLTLLVLLVCETVTGASDFPYLYGMMLEVWKHGILSIDAPAHVLEFLEQQTKMFQLFVPPFLGRLESNHEVHQRLDEFLDFLEPDLHTDAVVLPWIWTYKAAIGIARDIYVLEAGAVPQPEAVGLKLAALQSLTERVTIGTPGMHVLVWTYFIAAASSRTTLDREFFTRKLRQVYSVTKMRNILVALQTLEEVWMHFPSGGWARRVKAFRPVLAI